MLCETKGNIDFPEDNSKMIHLWVSYFVI
jgi:hypothetical protein